jgi:pimeloyl-ACP methyl ester carboxylesterase
MPPKTRYTRCGSINIAYQVAGDGPIDVVLVPGWISNIEVFWEEPNLARFMRRLAGFSRLILFDKRGTGLSDRPTDTPTLEERMEDLRATRREPACARCLPPPIPKRPGRW